MLLFSIHQVLSCFIFVLTCIHGTSLQPSSSPFQKTPSFNPTTSPSHTPHTSLPTSTPRISLGPTSSPTSSSPSISPNLSNPTRSPTKSPNISQPSKSPIILSPSHSPSVAKPSRSPSKMPSTSIPTHSPQSSTPTGNPKSSSPSLSPTLERPTRSPSHSPRTSTPSLRPITALPSRNPSQSPIHSSPSKNPTISKPTLSPSTTTNFPSEFPTRSPTRSHPSVTPTKSFPSARPTFLPSQQPTKSPTNLPTTKEPTLRPTLLPTNLPTTREPTTKPTLSPTSSRPSKVPTQFPTTKVPTKLPTLSPTFAKPSKVPTNFPTTKGPTMKPTLSPSFTKPSNIPTKFPTTKGPTMKPTLSPSFSKPSKVPTNFPTTGAPTSKTPTSKTPSASPTNKPSLSPKTTLPTKSPTNRPTTRIPTRFPTKSPIFKPTISPKVSLPTRTPSQLPTSRTPTSKAPTSKLPTQSPTKFPSKSPTQLPTSKAPTSKSPTQLPTSNAPTTLSPTPPTNLPTILPSINSPQPSNSPTLRPTTKTPTSKSPTTSPTPPTTKAPKSNVLFLMADDFKPLVTSYYPTNRFNNVGKTTNLDWLSTQGINFMNAHSQMTICSASRSSLLTSLRPDTIKVYGIVTNALGKVIRKSIAQKREMLTIPKLFKLSGYQTYGVGKIFHENEFLMMQDSETWTVPMYSWVSKLIRPPSFSSPYYGTWIDRPVVEDEFFCDGQAAKLAGELIRDVLTVSNKPWFLAVGLWKPHLPWHAPNKYFEQCGDVNDYPAAHHSGGAKLAKGTGCGEVNLYRGSPSTLGPGGASTYQMKLGNQAYHASALYMDAQIGKILKALNESNAMNNTHIIFLGDHGFHLGDHGLYGKHTNFEQATRVPLMIVPAFGQKHWKRNRRSFAPVELLDLMPTLYMLADLDLDLTPYKGWEGVPLQPILQDPENGFVKAAAVSQYFRKSGSGVIWGHSVRTTRYRYTEWERKLEELYDYRNDTWETSNIMAAQRKVNILPWMKATAFFNGKFNYGAGQVPWDFAERTTMASLPPQDLP